MGQVAAGAPVPWLPTGARCPWPPWRGAGLLECAPSTDRSPSGEPTAINAMRMTIRLRSFFLLLALCCAAGAASPSAAQGSGAESKLVILGFDGVDAKLTGRWMDEGKLP